MKLRIGQVHYSLQIEEARRGFTDQTQQQADLLDPEKALNNDGQQDVQRHQEEQKGIPAFHDPRSIELRTRFFSASS